MFVYRSFYAMRIPDENTAGIWPDSCRSGFTPDIFQGRGTRRGLFLLQPSRTNQILGQAHQRDHLHPVDHIFLQVPEVAPIARH